MRMISRLLHFLFGVRYPYVDALSRARARGLLAAAWLFILLIGTNFVLQFAAPNTLALDSRLNDVTVQQTVIAIILLDSLFLGLSLICIFLVKIGRLSSAALIFTSLLMVAGALNYVIIGLNSYMIIAFSAPLIAAGVFLDRRTLAVFLLLIVVLLLGLHLLDSVGALVNLTRRTGGVLFTIIRISAILALDAVMLMALIAGAEGVRSKLTLRSDEVRSLGRFTRAILGADRLETALTEAVETIREQLGYYHAQIFLIEEQTGLVLLRAASGMNEVQVMATRRRIAVGDAHPVNEVLRTAEAVRVDMSSPEELRAEFLPTTRSEALVTLTYGNTVTGVLDVHSVQPDAFTDADIEVLHMIAAELALMVHNARLVVKLQENNRLRLVLEEQLQTGAAERERQSQVQSGEREQERQEQRSMARLLQGRLDQQVGFDWRNGMLIANSETSDTQVQAMKGVVPETHDDETSGEHIMTVPIVLRSVVIGVMEFRSTRPGGWSSRHVDLARVISQRLALTLDNLNLFEQAQITANREQLVSQLSAQLQTRTDIDSLLELATDLFQRTLGASQANIRLGIPVESAFNSSNGHGNSNGNGSSAGTHE
ncbi:MAG: GAF domain-containing protein [Anaerolineae bacterium]